MGAVQSRSVEGSNNVYMGSGLPYNAQHQYPNFGRLCYVVHLHLKNLCGLEYVHVEFDDIRLCLHDYTVDKFNYILRFSSFVFWPYRDVPRLKLQYVVDGREYVLGLERGKREETDEHFVTYGYLCTQDMSFAAAYMFLTSLRLEALRKFLESQDFTKLRYLRYIKYEPGDNFETETKEDLITDFMSKCIRLFRERLVDTRVRNNSAEDTTKFLDYLNSKSTIELELMCITPTEAVFEFLPFAKAHACFNLIRGVMLERIRNAIVAIGNPESARAAREFEFTVNLIDQYLDRCKSKDELRRYLWRRGISKNVIDYCLSWEDAEDCAIRAQILLDVYPVRRIIDSEDYTAWLAWMNTSLELMQF